MMKAIRLFISIVLVLMAFSRCSTTYNTTVTGIEEGASISIVADNQSTNSYNNLVLLIDNELIEVDKVFSEKRSMKATKYFTEPGKHSVKITQKGKVLFDKQIFLANQEQRLIKLQ